MSDSHAIIAHAYAKVNLTLDVFSKRADGYHSIASVFQAVSLHDTVRLELRDEPGIAITCAGAEADGVPLDETNLACRAVHAILTGSDIGPCDGRAQVPGTRHSTPVPGVAIQLTKSIPSQAGLGGGSSDAAAALLAANRLCDLDLPRPALKAIAATLGSDVPFFLEGGTVVARGRGENLTALPDAPPLWLVIVKPEQSVPTGWAYAQLDAIPDRVSHRATKRMEEALATADMDRIVAWQSNDFEQPVFEQMPQLAWLHDELLMAGALTAHLCGSGAALYAVASGQADAARIARLMRLRYTRVYVAHTLTRAESDPLSATALVHPLTG